MGMWRLSCMQQRVWCMDRRSLARMCWLGHVRGRGERGDGQFLRASVGWRSCLSAVAVAMGDDVR
eukprot:1151180-Pelagomonas_calceolata.AAC.4